MDPTVKRRADEGCGLGTKPRGAVDARRAFAARQGRQPGPGGRRGPPAAGPGDLNRGRIVGRPCGWGVCFVFGTGRAPGGTPWARVMRGQQRQATGAAGRGRGRVAQVVRARP